MDCTVEGCGGRFADAKSLGAHLEAKHGILQPGSRKAIAAARWSRHPFPESVQKLSVVGGTPVCSKCYPLFVATVDEPHYCARLAETTQHLGECGWTPGSVVAVPLLLLSEHPRHKAKGILMEGWRAVMLPFIARWLQERAGVVCEECGAVGGPQYVVVAEDDIRFYPNHQHNDASLRTHSVRTAVHRVVARLHDSHPAVGIISLGHGWAQSQRKPLARHILEGGGAHGTTLMSLATDHIASIARGFEAARVSTHLDHFVFFTLDTAPVALLPRPVCGWADDAAALFGSRKAPRMDLERAPWCYGDATLSTEDMIVANYHSEGPGVSQEAG